MVGRSSLEIIYCPICGEEIHRQFSHPVGIRTKVSSWHPNPASVLTEMALAAEEAHQKMLRVAEDSCVQHIRTRHPTRYRLWRRFRKNWLITFRFRKLKVAQPVDANVMVFGGLD